MSKKTILRAIFYVLGINLIALGLVLNTNANLGTSPIISLAYTASFLCPITYANLTLILYLIMIVVELILNKKNKTNIWSILLQIPLSFVVTRLMSLYNNLFVFDNTSLIVRIIILFLAVIITGTGAALTLAMKVVPNPGDGFVYAISEYTNIALGNTKNIVDISCAIISGIVGFIAKGKLLGVGIGTIIAMICVGRVIAIFNKLFKKDLDKIIE